MTSKHLDNYYHRDKKLGKYKILDSYYISTPIYVTYDSTYFKIDYYSLCSDLCMVLLRKSRNTIPHILPKHLNLF